MAKTISTEISRSDVRISRVPSKGDIKNTTGKKVQGGKRTKFSPAASNKYSFDEIQKLKRGMLLRCNYCRKPFGRGFELKYHVAYECKALPRSLNVAKKLPWRSMDSSSLPIRALENFMKPLENLRCRRIIAPYDYAAVNIAPNKIVGRNGRRQGYLWRYSPADLIARRQEVHEAFEKSLRMLLQQGQVDVIGFPILFWANQPGRLINHDRRSHAALLVVRVGSGGRLEASYHDSFSQSQTYQKLVFKHVWYLLRRACGQSVSFSKQRVHIYNNICWRACGAVMAHWAFQLFNNGIVDDPYHASVVDGLRARIIYQRRCVVMKTTVTVRK